MTEWEDFKNNYFWTMSIKEFKEMPRPKKYCQSCGTKCERKYDSCPNKKCKDYGVVYYHTGGQFD